MESFNSSELALDSWFGLWAPAGTPPTVVDVLFRAVTRVYDDPAVRADSEALGTLVSLSQSPEEFKTFMQSETLKFQKLVEAAKLSVNN